MPANVLVEALRPVVDLVYPPRCPLCGDALAAQEGLCHDCWQTLDLPGGNDCARCGMPTANRGVCAACTAAPPACDRIVAATFYNDASRQLVLKFKHGRRIALARLMSRMMARHLPHNARDSVLVPVPLHWRRLWERGYNQSALLAHEMGRATGAIVALDVLKRSRATPSLGQLGRRARAEILRDAILPTRNAARIVGGRRVIVVDDVYTSGATGMACVRALRQAGAEAVTISCFARVTDH